MNKYQIKLIETLKLRNIAMKFRVTIFTLQQVNKNII